MRKKERWREVERCEWVGGSDHRCGLFICFSTFPCGQNYGWVWRQAGPLSLHEHVDLSEGGRNKKVDLCTGNLSSHSL